MEGLLIMVYLDCNGFVRYESKASQGIYEKLMSKYETNPDDPMSKFAKAKPKQVKNLQEAKDRMKEALRREELGERDPEQRR